MRCMVMIFRIVANFMLSVFFLQTCPQFFKTIYYSQFSLFFMKSQKLSENTLKLAKYKQRFTIAIVFRFPMLCIVLCAMLQSTKSQQNKQHFSPCRIHFITAKSSTMMLRYLNIIPTSAQTQTERSVDHFAVWCGAEARLGSAL